MRKILNLLVIVIVVFAAWSILGEEANGPATQESESSAEVAVDQPTETEATGTHTLDTAQSEVRWTGKKSIGDEHFGTIGLKSGSLNLDGDVAGSFVIDMTMVDSKDLSGSLKESLDKHLMSDDFFASETYPESLFTITNLEPAFSTDVTEYTLTGDLTLKDITKEISFPVVVEHGTSGLKVEATTSIDRTEWEVKYGSGKFFKELGDKLIEDNIELILNLVFKTN